MKGKTHTVHGALTPALSAAIDLYQ